jgi:endonuclease-3
MTYSLFTEVGLEQIHLLLLDHYGKPEPRVPWDPLTQFIYSLLSSRTKTQTSHEVLQTLRDRFGTWENLRDAPMPEIEDAIRAATFPERKAIQLKQALEQITARTGSLSLDFIRNYQTEKIRTWLEAFDGVDVKTSGAVVNFSTLRRKALCIDSHHLRVAKRLKLVPNSADARETERRLMLIAPATWTAETLDEHHALVKLHAQKRCTFEHPKCTGCPLLQLCPTGLRTNSTSV